VGINESRLIAATLWQDLENYQRNSFIDAYTVFSKKFKEIGPLVGLISEAFSRSKASSSVFSLKRVRHILKKHKYLLQEANIKKEISTQDLAKRCLEFNITAVTIIEKLNIDFQHVINFDETVFSKAVGKPITLCRDNTLKSIKNCKATETIFAAMIYATMAGKLLPGMYMMPSKVAPKFETHTFTKTPTRELFIKFYFPALFELNTNHSNEKVVGILESWKGQQPSRENPPFLKVEEKKISFQKTKS